MSHSQTFARRTEAKLDAIESGYDQAGFEIDELPDGFAWKPVIDPDDETPPKQLNDGPAGEVEVAPDVAEEDVATEDETSDEPDGEASDEVPDHRTKLTLQLDGEFYGETGIMWAGKIAKMLRKEQIGVRVLNADSGGVISVYRGGPNKERKPVARPVGHRVERDWSVKPIITSTTNQYMQRLIDKIAEAEGDAAKLRALDTFNRTSTYYKLAGRYLDELLARAEPKPAATEQESAVAA